MTLSSADPRASEHTSAEGLALLRSLLLCQLAEYADRATEYRATVEALTGQSDADSLLERELAETSVTHFDTVMQEARAALLRMDIGAYGLCETCSAPIPFERLEAVPHARRCVSCPASSARSFV